MMDLLKQLKRIAPDPSFSARSRIELLAQMPVRIVRPSLWQFLGESVASAGALALVGILLLVAVGGFSAWNFLTPLRIASLDPAGLTAEAEAIDIQIQLAGVGYTDSPMAESTPAIAGTSTLEQRHNRAAHKLAEGLGVVQSTATTTEEGQVTIDDALSALAE
ncbi:MAG: hypothetical protein RL681_614 [Candidatus Parcubacteria bacterium]|jgi:hypothetical protein